MRNPDHLASDILTCIERGEADGLSPEMAEELVEGDEPELRLYPMLRHLFGAFKPIDDSMAHLVSVGLARCHRLGDPARLKRTDFWLLPAGRATAARIVRSFLSSAGMWYADRADLVALVARADSGNRLKDRHYLVEEYANTPHGQLIPPVADSVRRRLAEMRRPAP